MATQIKRYQPIISDNNYGLFHIFKNGAAPAVSGLSINNTSFTATVFQSQPGTDVQFKCGEDTVKYENERDFIVQRTGTYKITISFEFPVPSSSSDINFGLIINGVDNKNKARVRLLTTNLFNVTRSHPYFLMLKKNDIIQVGIERVQAGVVTISILNATVTFEILPVKCLM